MRYEIVLSPQASADIENQPVAVRAFVMAQLRNLAASPTSLSRPSRFPYREKCQIFQFDMPFENETWRFAALFQFAQDEQSIFVIGVGVTRGPMN